MAIDYTNYAPDFSALDPFDGSTGRFGGVDPNYLRTASRIRTFFKKPKNYSKNAGLGYVLPNIGGLRLKEITTPQGKRTAIVGGPGGYTYGLAAAGAAKNLMIGRDAKGRIALVRRGARPATGPGGTPGPGGGTPGSTTPAPDEYQKYEKDYPWMASYLRGLRDEENAFNKKFKDEFQPSVSAALESYGNLGVGAADRYARAAAASVAANRAAQNIAPTEAAGATGSFDPVAVAAQQAASRATGDAAAENARMAATTSALAPATAAQGLLANIQRGYATISAEYSRKRLEDQMKLDQWIETQKQAALDREVQQQYNLGLLKLRGDELTFDVEKAKAEAATKGQFTNAELAAKGFRTVKSVAGAGPKNKAKIAATTVTSVEGEQWYKPSGGGGGGGGGGLTANQQQQLGPRLLEAYQGTTRDALGNITGQGPGFRDLPLEQQVGRIEQWVRQEVERGNIPRDADAIARFISTSIPFLQKKVGSGYKTDPRGRTDTWGRRIAKNIVGG